jgi:hypothetical protein
LLLGLTEKKRRYENKSNKKVKKRVGFEREVFLFLY